MMPQPYAELRPEIQNVLFQNQRFGLFVPPWDENRLDCPISKAAITHIDETTKHIRKFLNVDEDIEGFIIKSKTINAFAFAEPNFFVFTELLVHGLYNVAARLIITDKLLSVITEQQIAPKDKFIDRIDALANLFFCPLVPTGDEDRTTALAVFTIALSYIAAHELGHIINGHIKSGIREVIISDNPPDKAEDLRLTSLCLEYDADCFAAQHVTYICAGRLGLFSTPPTRDQRVDLYRNVLAGIGIAQLFFEFSEGGIINAERSHPEALSRWLGAGIMMMTIDNAIFPGTEEINMAELFDDVSISREAALYACGAPVSDYIHSLKCSGGTTIAFSDAMDSRWAMLRGHLSKAKLGTHELAPIAQGISSTK